MWSMSLKYDALFDVLNIKEDLTWNETLSFLRVKETELLDMGILKEEMAHYTSRSGYRSFWGWGSYWDRPGGRSWIQSGKRFPRATIKYYVCQRAYLFKEYFI